MADELNPRMDRQLREYAQTRRREAARGELHPATRHLLQSEVARVYGPARFTREPNRRPWSLPWFRLAFAGGGLALLLLAGTVWLSLVSRPRESRPPSQLGAQTPDRADRVSSGPTLQLSSPEAPSLTDAERTVSPAKGDLHAGGPGSAGQQTLAGAQMAKRLATPASKPAAVEGSALLAAADAASVDQPAAAPVPEGAAVATPAPDLRRQEPGRAAAESLAKETSLLLTARTVGPNVELSERLARDQVVAESASDGVAAVALSREATPTPKDVSVALAAARDETPGAMVAFFKNETLARGQSAVLNTFRLVQSGDEVRLIDGDGSIYVGQAVTTATPTAGSTGSGALSTASGQGARASSGAAAIAPSALHGEKSVGRQVYNFTARGTNLTLNQLVVVQGQFEAGTIPAGPANGAGQAGPARSRVALGVSNAAVASQPPQSPVTLLQGQATVGGSNTILIRAVPVPP